MHNGAQADVIDIGVIVETVDPAAKTARLKLFYGSLAAAPMSDFRVVAESTAELQVDVAPSPNTLGPRNQAQQEIKCASCRTCQSASPPAI